MKLPIIPTSLIAIAYLICFGLIAAVADPNVNDNTVKSLEVRPLDVGEGDGWLGEAISYGMFRDGQKPGGDANPSREHFSEDLHIIAKHWKLIRTYGSTDAAEVMLQVIRDEKLPIKVLLGAWIGSEQHLKPGEELNEWRRDQKAGNPLEVTAVIRLANKFPEIVIAVSVGNETQVMWTGHKVDADILIKYIRQVRAGVKVPVTTADDYMFWETEASKEVANEIDFIITHIHPAWRKKQLNEALEYVDTTYQAISKMHEGKQVVLGETGWPTVKMTTGLQGKLMLGKVGEPEQAVFFKEMQAWTHKNQVVTFYFQAFDGKWKGAEGEPDHAEKHWGLYLSDRTPKLVFKKGLGSSK